MTCGLTTDQYCNLSRAKLGIGKHHVRGFKAILRTAPNLVVSPDDRVRLPLYSHADGAVFQLYAACDSYACGVAHEYGFKAADKASFMVVAQESRAPAVLALRMRNTTSSKRWTVLEDLRNVAGHRGVVSRFLVVGQQLGETRAYLGDRSHPDQRGRGTAASRGGPAALGRGSAPRHVALAVSAIGRAAESRGAGEKSSVGRPRWVVFLEDYRRITRRARRAMERVFYEEG